MKPGTAPLILAALAFFPHAGLCQSDPAADKEAFEAAERQNWKEVFSDPCTGDWKQSWFLDGEVGTVKSEPDGMTLTAGSEYGNDAHHMVLWTKEPFSGDLKIDFDYTRLDAETRCVNILYIQATGSGEGPHDPDIAKWGELRRVPSMATYFNHMKAYHLSYAAFPNDGKGKAYIRARRYMPEKNGIKGTDLKPDYFPEELFKTGVKHNIKVIKKDRDLFVRIQNPEQVYHCHFRNTDLPAITEGRIGLRHMFTRSARYANFRISTPAGAGEEADRFDNHEGLVAETHAASLKLREQALRKTIAKDTCWPGGVWGDNLWTLAALHLNERVDEANARLLKAANEYIETCRKTGDAANPTPEQNTGAPWTFFSITDYVRTLCLFHSKSTHFPGRFKPETETAMKEALWLWTSKESRIADYGVDDLFLLLGTENHDLNKRPVHYLVTSLLKDDPAYRARKLADGHSTAEHAAAHAAFFREWARTRAGAGMWIEVGSDTYQKYSWPALLNLHELSPDPVIRHRFGLLLYLALVEEAQISVKGRRGGGRSRAHHAPGGFEPMKAILYGEGGGSTHSRVIEASKYQAPAEAVLLRKRAFPAEEPFVIRNRVLGKLGAGEGHRIDPASMLVNYAYRTPHYLLGCTLQNPAIEYTGISKQNRTCGLLFDNPSSLKTSQIYPFYEHIGGGRPQHSIWSVQHENALIVQRINRVGKGHPGSYNTGRLGVRFEGDDLATTEQDGWIFSGNGKAFAAVKLLDGGHVWDESKTLANPADFSGNDDTTRILFHAGDISTYASFDAFREAILKKPLSVEADKVDYRFGGNRIEMTRYDAKTRQLQPATHQREAGRSESEGRLRKPLPKRASRS